MNQDDAIVRLARQIDATKKAENFLVNAEEVTAVRRQGACDLYRICAEFAAAVNARLAEARLELSPPSYAPEVFRESGPNLVQIGSEGREMQIVFEAPRQLVSTEKFLVPYVLEGEVRAYNQSMLERSAIKSQLLFYCVERGSAAWRFYDWRTRRTGPLGRELLVSLMEPLF
jgi:hypothetical protein